MFSGSGLLSCVANVCSCRFGKLPKITFSYCKIEGVQNPRYLSEKMHGTEVEDDHASERGSSVNSQLSLPLFPLVHAGEGGDQSDFGLPLIPCLALIMCFM